MFKIVRHSKTGDFTWEVRGNPFMAKAEAERLAEMAVMPGSTWTVEPATLHDIAHEVVPIAEFLTEDQTKQMEQMREDLYVAEHARQGKNQKVNA